MAQVLIIVVYTLIIYSFISTILFLSFKENETIYIYFGAGIVGLIFWGTTLLASKIMDLFKYHIGKRSIFKSNITGEKYKCRVGYTRDIEYMNNNLTLIKRYAKKGEWVDIQNFSNEIIKNRKRNCSHCKYEDECGASFSEPKCKHDKYGSILEYDRFVIKK